ncbi:MAG: helix-turn-helix domain-containing protein [Peptococcaceae bacterium]|nr:helix-turn-helix domain-containing protein [Peptococcaceae bacterium]
MENNTITVSEFSKMLKISRVKAYQIINQGKIKTIRVGRCIRIPLKEYEKFIKAGGTC